MDPEFLSKLFNSPVDIPVRQVKAEVGKGNLHSLPEDIVAGIVTEIKKWELEPGETNSSRKEEEDSRL